MGFAASLLLLATGCVGPMACGPTGCDGRGHGRGCDELYVDPWINHRADICDPCDGCGNYNGQSCGKCRPIFTGYRSLWGYRMDPPPPPCDHSSGCGLEGCGLESHGGCDSCAATAPPSAGHRVLRDPQGQHPGVPTPAPEVIWEDERVEEVPPPEVETDTSGDQSHYTPQRRRQIFRSRGGVAKAAR